VQRQQTPTQTNFKEQCHETERNAIEIPGCLFADLRVCLRGGIKQFPGVPWSISHNDNSTSHFTFTSSGFPGDRNRRRPTH
jgi:hypothetical protein